MCGWTARVSKPEPLNREKIIKYNKQEITMSPLKARYPYRLWKRLLGFECLVQTLSKVGLDAHGLQNKYTHPNNTLFCWIGLVSDSIEYAKNYEIVGTVRVNDEGSKSFVALQSFPEEDQHLWGPFYRFLAARKVCGCSLHL
jgi:hypothetical protein